MTRQERQDKILETLIQNNYIGTIVATPGFGKSKVAIDAVASGNFTDVLIVSPRTNLKKNWRDELEKWIHQSSSFLTLEYFTIENIQTAYKWSYEDIAMYDLIIFDEIHTIVTEEYSRLLKIAKNYDIPRIGLTGTPDVDKDDKAEMYREYCPIIYEYYGSDKDGLINKRKIYVYKYALDDKHIITIETKNKTWQSGEKTHYDYLEKTIENSVKFVKNHYFNTLKARAKHLFKVSIIPPINEEDHNFMRLALSKDLDHFYEVTRPRYDNRDMSHLLYRFIQEIKGYNYSVMGLNAIRMLDRTDVPDEVKPHIRKYWWAINRRKKMLWTLSSSAHIAKFIKEQILANSNNKVLLFSELTEQAEKLSANTIHSNNDKEHNAKMLKLFNSGKIRELSSCQSLTLGLNLKGANFAIFESYNSSNTNNEQKSGRTNRLPVEDTASLIYIVPRQTQAENWFNNLNLQETILIQNLEDVIEKFNE